jgi:hypothetical protein
MLTYVFCEGVFLLKKITITVDDVTLDCLCAMRELNGTPFSAAIRLAVLSYYQDKVSISPAKKK